MPIRDNRHQSVVSGRMLSEHVDDFAPGQPVVNPTYSSSEIKPDQMAVDSVQTLIHEVSVTTKDITMEPEKEPPRTIVNTTMPIVSNDVSSNIINKQHVPHMTVPSPVSSVIDNKAMMMSSPNMRMMTPAPNPMPNQQFSGGFNNNMIPSQVIQNNPYLSFSMPMQPIQPNNQQMINPMFQNYNNVRGQIPNTGTNTMYNMNKNLMAMNNMGMVNMPQMNSNMTLANPNLGNFDQQLNMINNNSAFSTNPPNSSFNMEVKRQGSSNSINEQKQEDKSQNLNQGTSSQAPQQGMQLAQLIHSVLKLKNSSNSNETASLNNIISNQFNSPNLQQQLNNIKNNLNMLSGQVTSTNSNTGNKGQDKSTDPRVRKKR